MTAAQKFFLSVLMHLINTNGQKMLFTSVGITRFVLLLGKASNFNCYQKSCYEIVASKKKEIPHYRGIDLERGRCFGAFPQVIGRTAFSFLRKYVVPAVKLVGGDSMEIVALEISDVVDGKDCFKSAAKSVGRRILRKQLKNCRKQRIVISAKSTKQASWSSGETFTNIACYSNQTSSGNNLWWQFLETLEGKSQ